MIVGGGCPAHPLSHFSCNYEIIITGDGFLGKQASVLMVRQTKHIYLRFNAANGAARP